MKKNKIIFPKKIIICGQTYKVEYVAKPSDVDSAKEESYFGQIDYRKGRIGILKTLDKDDMLCRLLHEITHGVLEVMKKNDLRKDESFVNTFASIFGDTLIRNKIVGLK